MAAPSAPIPVALLGATGAVGQRFAQLLRDHPWFRLAEVVASPRSAGLPYGAALGRPESWWLDDEPDPLAAVGRAADLVLLDSTMHLESPLVFSALGASVAGPIESRLAANGHLVVSNARSHRMDPDVPIVVPEVNPQALELVHGQPSFARGRGAIVTNPNCTTAGLALALAPLREAFGLEAVYVFTMQALSGAGRAGLAPPRLANDLVPFIAGEEEKLLVETRKIFGDPQLAVGATCTRVPVVDGHTLVVSAKLAREVAKDDVVRAFTEFTGEPQRLGLPSAPVAPVHYHHEPDAPRPSRHRDLDRGMATHVGRLRPGMILDWNFVALTHNTRRGAAGGSILLAELAVERGLVGRG
ncbi:Aspartate-semialdehyde dehydrogenase 2 [Planctomycetes bacterium Pla163]|uniref:Aspartate-semialdehyde dehydrogenase 2 n=1 Tax=Rohdeia mirabilis TaxID=2528008 RepID=A0A518D4F3_9BACT|nr:Aspartate-semialdehyde dehydrogenase 2 [Planctomycetes bacterium Pla163]